jgi:hypothetical protein
VASAAADDLARNIPEKSASLLRGVALSVNISWGGAVNTPRDDCDAVGLLANECPLDPALRLRPETALSSALPSSLGPDVLMAAASAIANLVAATRDGKEWVFYSRDWNYYAGLGRYRPGWFRRKVVLAAVDALEGPGLIEHRRTRPSAHATLRSAIRFAPGVTLPATAELIEQPSEVIVLRSESKEHVCYRDTRLTRRMRRDVLEHNAFLKPLALEIRGPEAQVAAPGLLTVRGRPCHLHLRSYRRVFNGDFRHGGRWYGPFWQSLPSDIRSTIHINGLPVVELDYRSCHYRLLAAAYGLITSPTADPFEATGAERAHIKRAFHIMLNAATRSAAERALANELRTAGLADAYQRSTGLIDEVLHRFSHLAPSLLSGVGPRLQNIDAGICARVQQRLRAKDIPCLSVHDSFLVQAQHHKQLEAIMQLEFEAESEELRSRKHI